MPPAAALFVLLAGLRFAAGQAASSGQAASPLPGTETALWINTFVAVVSLDADLNETQTVLEDALRDQYTAAGYAVDIVDLQGCPAAPPASIVDGPSAPASSPEAVQAALAALPPVPAPAAASVAQDALQPVLVRAGCFVLNVTLSFDPAAGRPYLDAAAGTSGAIIQALRGQSVAEGLQAELYLLTVHILPSISRVMLRTGDSLQRVLEVGYRTSIWVEGAALPVDRAQRLAVLAAFRALRLETLAGVARYRVAAASRNATGFGVTLLAIVRPSDASVSYTQAFAALAANQTLLAALREVGLPAAAARLVSNTQDNSTTVGSQLSAILASDPVISSIGAPPVAPGRAGSAASDVGSSGSAAAAAPTGGRSTQPLGAGGIAGIAVGAACAITLLALLPALWLRWWRRRREAGPRERKPRPPQSGLDSGAQWHAPLPTPRSSPAASMGGAARRNSLAISAWSVGSWQLPPHSIKICCRPDGSEFVLGRGMYGVVYKAVLDGRTEVAVKMLNRVDEWQLQQFRREIDLLRALPADPNVVQFYGACLDCECPFLVLEYMAGGDLRDALSSPELAPLLDWHRNGQRVALDVARGLSFLHSHGVIHADLKSKNVLLSADCSVAKVGDVGLSRVMQGSHASAGSDAFTFTYAAPEQILGYDLTAQVDSFAFSVLLWELATKEPPVRGQLHSVDSPRQCPHEVAQLIERGLARNPAERPSAEEACELLAALAERSVRIPDVDVVPQLQPPQMYVTSGW